MKVNKHLSLDLEVVQALEEFKEKNPKFSASYMINAYLKSYLNLTEENELDELKEKTMAELKESLKKKFDNPELIKSLEKEIRQEIKEELRNKVNVEKEVTKEANKEADEAFGLE